MPENEPRITKRKVTMRNPVITADGSVIMHEVIDYVNAEDTPGGSPAILDDYVARAKTRWQYVAVSDEPDAGPGGYDGPTFIPADLAHPAAGRYFEPGPNYRAPEATVEG